jgi:hypothetical protein
MFEHRHGFSNGQEVLSTDPQDAVEPRGFIFSFRPKAARAEDRARVVFEDNAIRDVLLVNLVAVEGN